ncbi:endonuclease MutS2 [Helicobacter sp. MIT 05-5293]|uniref:endonuclease MutS2 n=1 Tax=Helicobacter sp. MIT 05-5293 TaxID=1548149 RepID=UPI00051D6475|nr:endonuclease MutS2 [Helicobacter sp. MIT 05-5293]TLD80419.1 endonuclease MutS2 [Helicobacter sp. MIT 05-5293]
MTENNILASKLDLQEFLAKFATFFARQKDVFFEGDRVFYAKILKEIELSPPLAPPRLCNLDTPLIHLQKFGTLKFDEIFEMIKLVRYFVALKHSILPSLPYTFQWLEKIQIPIAIKEMDSIFTLEGELKEGIYEQIDYLKRQIQNTKGHINQTLNQLLHSAKLAPYLVDSSVHYLNENECFLLKAGYHHAIKGMILERSASGFFYLLPDVIMTLKERQNTLKDSLETSLYEVCKSLSNTLHKHLPFLRFLNKSFDQWDHIYARLCFAKTHSLEFVYEMSKKTPIILKDFCHPALANPKAIDLEWDKDLLMITGVNAGGKTMLLKSVLSACFLTKFLLPLKINPHKSQIPHFKHIIAIISDPQNSKNDISTFAGRMLEFSQILQTQNMLLGIDEIELGTDADEAASLYKVLLEHLLQNNTKILLTTHHKRLASLMANNHRIQLCAAMYDVKAQKPLFSFLYGSIGKSYAFETAQNYGIPSTLITQAKTLYGQDKERLNDLIQRSNELEMQLQEKSAVLDSHINTYKRQIENLNDERTAQKNEFQTLKNALEQTYNQALQTLKNALKSQDSKQMHQAMNKAHHIIKTDAKHSLPPLPHSAKISPLKVGDFVKYGNTRGKIIAINKDTYSVELESGFKLKEKRENLKPLGAFIPTSSPQKYQGFSKAKSVGVSLDLHGMRGEEAIERLDIFLNDALIAGYDEVLVYHGIGTGVLSKLVKEYLCQHPKILSFDDAPPQMGGFGAKIIKL